MKILIKFDYENKTYYMYQEDNEIKYGTNEDMKNVSLEDENIIKKVIEKLRPSKYLIELTPFVYNGKKYDIYLDTKTSFKIFNPIPDEKEIIKFNKIFNDMPLELNVELNNSEKEFIRKAVTLGKKTVVAFLASTIILSNTSFFPDIIINAKVDNEITYIEDVKEDNIQIPDEEFLSIINNAIMENENLTTDEKIFMMSNSYFFLDNKEYINIDKLIRKLKKLKIEYSPLTSNKKIRGNYSITENKINIYASTNFKDSDYSVLSHEFMHACQDFGFTKYNSFLVETTNALTTYEYYGKDDSYRECVKYIRALIELVGKDAFKKFQCYPKEEIIVQELCKIINSPTKAIKFLNDLNTYKSLLYGKEIENIDDVIAPLKDEIYNTFKSYYKAKYNKDIENDLIMMNYLNEEELLNKIKKEYNLNDEYEIVFVKNKYYLNTVLNESLENELMIVLNKKYIVPEELTNIFINDSNRLVENKLVK